MPEEVRQSIASAPVIAALLFGFSFMMYAIKRRNIILGISALLMLSSFGIGCAMLHHIDFLVGRIAGASCFLIAIMILIIRSVVLIIRNKNNSIFIDSNDKE